MDKEKNLQLKSRYLDKEVVELLNSTTPREWVDTRPVRGGKKDARFVSSPKYNEVMNIAFGYLWSQEVLKLERVDNDVVATVRITVEIPGYTIVKELPDGTRETIVRASVKIIKEQCGGTEIKKWAKTKIDPATGITEHKAGDVIDLGDDYKAAVTDAKKKCISELGIFADIYSDSDRTDGKGPTRSNLESLYNASKLAGMDEDKTNAWVTEITGKKLEDCEPVEVMGLLPKLRKLAEALKE